MDKDKNIHTTSWEEVENTEEEFDIDSWTPPEEIYEGDSSVHDIPKPRQESTLSEGDFIKQRYQRIEKNLSSYTIEQKNNLKEQLILKAVEEARDNFYAYVLLMAPLRS